MIFQENLIFIIKNLFFYKNLIFSMTNYAGCYDQTLQMSTFRQFCDRLRFSEKTFFRKKNMEKDDV